MKDIERKALRLVADGNVEVHGYSLGELGNVEYAYGFVQGDNAIYRVSLDPSGCTCTCVHGQTKPGQHHSHDAALRLAAWNEIRKQKEGGTT